VKVPLLPAVLAGALVLAAPAAAQVGTLEIPDAVDSLRTDPVYVDPDAENAISASEERELEQRIETSDAAPLYVAIVPDSARQEAGGSAIEVARQLAMALNRRGVYAVIAGDQFRAGNVQGGLDQGVAGALADRAIELKRDEGADAVLLEFVDLVAEARANGGEAPGDDNDPGGGGAGALGLLALAGGGALLFSLRGRRRRRRAEEAQAAELRDNARDDLVALGDDVRALDLDVEMPDADPHAKEHYGRALTHYEKAERALDHAKRPEDFAPIGEALEQGRYEMAAAKARLEGREPPEHRPPCFFDPRHGPSTRDVDWAPDGYQPRPVPVCEADAVRIESGELPMTRQIQTAGGMVPMYDAPGYYGPYAGGFFGGFTGFLPGILFGSLLGSSLGGFGGFGGAAYGDGGGFGGGDLGGGGLDFGDFGGGGGFGGGDFGGGDF